jgi:hypothetical protein
MRYLACRAAIPKVAWTNGTMAVPRAQHGQPDASGYEAPEAGLQVDYRGLDALGRVLMERASWGGAARGDQPNL